METIRKIVEVDGNKWIASKTGTDVSFVPEDEIEILKENALKVFEEMTHGKLLGVIYKNGKFKVLVSKANNF